jgi:hypothetical protein
MPMPPWDAPHAPQPPDATLHLLNEERAQRARLNEALLERERELASERGKRHAAEQALLVRVRVRVRVRARARFRVRVRFRVS